MFSLLFQICLLWKSLFILFAAEDNDLRICLTEIGCLQGTTRADFQTGEEYEAFMGIPFAAPPVGELRLKNPVPAAAWQDDVLDATKRKDVCRQKNFIAKDPQLIYGSEDCLYLNIYKPKNRNAEQQPLPVFFFIHAGGYISGSPHMFEPDYLMRTKEIIMVTTAYRLGPLGFLSTGNENMPGNFGLKDQNLALKWVQQHIASFGGNPELVTISGHSAGSSSVHQHMLSEASRGLFQRAMSFSGIVFTPFARTIDEPLEQARQMARACQIEAADTLSANDLAERLRAKDADTLLEAGEIFHTWRNFPHINFGAVIEQNEWPNAFLTEHTKTLQRNGKIAQVPWLVTTVPNLGGGGVFVTQLAENGILKKELNEDFDNKMGIVLDIPKNNAVDLLKELMAAYTNGVHELNNNTLDSIAELLGDYYYMYPIYRTLQTYTENIDPSQLYLLKFNFKGPYSFSKIIFGGTEHDYGVSLLDDTIYAFYIQFLYDKGFEPNTPNAKMVERYVRLLVDFAKFGKIISPTNTNACTANDFQSGTETNICEYLNFENDNDGFKEFKVRNFEVRAKETWQKVLGF